MERVLWNESTGKRELEVCLTGLKLKVGVKTEDGNSLLKQGDDRRGEGLRKLDLKTRHDSIPSQ